MRIQPELLATAYYTIAISLTPVLLNPVEGATNKSIGSFYGDQRDGGARKHEGVDIFARKGTHVIAPTDGYITQVRTGGLGGKVVWMQDTKRHHAYYFAHLDSQAVKPNMRIRKGELIGTVGNTGNARTTPSHLHFGIYQAKSKDPLDYIRTTDPVTAASPWDTTARQLNFKVVAKTARLRMGPAERQPVIGDLRKDTFLHVIAQSADWYRVLLPNNKQGFILKSKAAPIARGRRMHVKQPLALLTETSHLAAPILYLTKGTSIEVLAGFENYRYVRTKDGVMGWIAM